MIIKGAPAQSFRRSQAAILGFLGKIFWENTGQNAKFGAIKVVTMTFKCPSDFQIFWSSCVQSTARLGRSMLLKIFKVVRGGGLFI